MSQDVFVDVSCSVIYEFTKCQRAKAYFNLCFTQSLRKTLIKQLTPLIKYLHIYVYMKLGIQKDASLLSTLHRTILASRSARQFHELLKYPSSRIERELINVYL